MSLLEILKWSFRGAGWRPCFGSQALKIISNGVNDTLQRCNYIRPIGDDGSIVCITARTTRGQTVGGIASSTHRCNNLYFLHHQLEIETFFAGSLYKIIEL